LRDLTERVIVASKGRFDRARSPKARERSGLPFENTISKDDYMRWTTDVWDIPPESARSVGHPAPFPVELPQRLIELYTYRDDLVLDPFMGSGTTAVAAINTHRHYLGFETDSEYAVAARNRADQALHERVRREQSKDGHRQWWFVSPPTLDGDDELDFQSRAVREGRMAKEFARELIERAGFVDIREKRKVAAGVEVNFVATDSLGNTWYFDVSGAFSKGNDRAGLRRTDTLWKALGKASAIHETTARDEGDARPYRLVLLTTDLPQRSSAGSKALTGVTGADKPIFDAISMMTPDGQQRLADYALHGPHPPTT
jgi:site-specific DNA-methyltransferase (adenine-specific)